MEFSKEGLYECDPEKNTSCKKSGCGVDCKYTKNPKYAKTVETCEYCNPTGKYIGITDYEETRLFVRVSGSYIQIFDENYPGMTDSYEIAFCPMCGRPLK